MKFKMKIDAMDWFGLVKVNMPSVIHIINILILFTFLTNLSLANATESKSDESSKVCIIGRLRMCSENEECVETPKNAVEVKVRVSSVDSKQTEDVNSSTQVSKPNNSDRVGVCVCIDHCHPKPPMSDQSVDVKPKAKSSTGLILGIFTAISLFCGCVFAIYYYGIRYGMIRHYARRLGLTNNTHNDHQLLNTINSNDEDVELAI